MKKKKKDKNSEWKVPTMKEKHTSTLSYAVQIDQKLCTMYTYTVKMKSFSFIKLQL